MRKPPTLPEKGAASKMRKPPTLPEKGAASATSQVFASASTNREQPATELQPLAPVRAPSDHVPNGNEPDERNSRARTSPTRRQGRGWIRQAAVLFLLPLRLAANALLVYLVLRDGGLAFGGSSSGSNREAFDDFVEEFSSRYAFFRERGVNWTATVADAKATFVQDYNEQRIPDEKTFDFLCNLIHDLDDQHTMLLCPHDTWADCETAADVSWQIEERYFALARRRAEESMMDHGYGYGYGHHADRDTAETDYEELLDLHYLGGSAKQAAKMPWNKAGIVYGLIDRSNINGTSSVGQSKRIGYIALREMASVLGVTGLVGSTDAVIHAQISKVLEDLGCEELAGLVVDNRMNRGGFDRVSLALAAHFGPDENSPEVQAFYKEQRVSDSSPGAADAPTFADNTQPDLVDCSTCGIRHVPSAGGYRRYTGPVVLLNSRLTVSAGETFAMAMQSLGRARIAAASSISVTDLDLPVQPITILGEHTNGAYSDMRKHKVAGTNGWVTYLSTQRYSTPTGVYPEVVGTMPDVSVSPALNLSEFRNTGIDAALDQALTLLNSGTAPTASSNDVRRRLGCPGSVTNVGILDVLLLIMMWAVLAPTIFLLHKHDAPNTDDVKLCFGTIPHRHRVTVHVVLSVLAGALFTAAEFVLGDARPWLLVLGMVLLFAAWVHIANCGHYPLGFSASDRLWRRLNHPGALLLLSWATWSAAVAAILATISAVTDNVDGVAAAAGCFGQLVALLIQSNHAAAAASSVFAAKQRLEIARSLFSRQHVAVLRARTFLAMLSSSFLLAAAAYMAWWSADLPNFVEVNIPSGPLILAALIAPVHFSVNEKDRLRTYRSRSDRKQSTNEKGRWSTASSGIAYDLSVGVNWTCVRRCDCSKLTMDTAVLLIHPASALLAWLPAGLMFVAIGCSVLRDEHPAPVTSALLFALPAVSVLISTWVVTVQTSMMLRQNRASWRIASKLRARLAVLRARAGASSEFTSNMTPEARRC